MQLSGLQARPAHLHAGTDKRKLMTIAIEYDESDKLPLRWALHERGSRALSESQS